MKELQERVEEWRTQLCQRQDEAARAQVRHICPKRRICIWKETYKQVECIWEKKYKRNSCASRQDVAGRAQVRFIVKSDI